MIDIWTLDCDNDALDVDGRECSDYSISNDAINYGYSLSGGEIWEKYVEIVIHMKKYCGGNY